LPDNLAGAVIQGILLGGLYSLLASGLSILFGVMRVINLAHGDLAILGAYAAIVLITVAHLPVAVALIAVVPLFFGLGYLGQRALIQPALERGPLTTLIVSFGLSVLIQNLLLTVFSADSHSIDIGSLITGSIRLSDEISIADLSVGIFAVAVLVLLALEWFFSRTTTGRLIRAVADDREAAQLSGVRYRHIFGIAAGLAMITAAFAGLAFGMYSSFGPSSGTTRLLFAFEAVVIGGLGSLWGTLVGGIVLGLAQSVASAIDPSFSILAGHLVFLAVLAVRPQGIVAGRST
jgi:branched-chain amino acid transport system permease protein